MSNYCRNLSQPGCDTSRPWKPYRVWNAPRVSQLSQLSQPPLKTISTLYFFLWSGDR